MRSVGYIYTTAVMLQTKICDHYVYSGFIVCILPEPKITSCQRSISVQTTRRSRQRQCHADNMSGHGAAPANVISMAFGASIVYIAYIYMYVARPCTNALDRASKKKKAWHYAIAVRGIPVRCAKLRAQSTRGS